MIDQNTLGKRYWGATALFATDGNNKIPNSLSNQIEEGISPEEAATRIKPNISNCNLPFGALVTCHKIAETKFLESQNELGVAVGRQQGQGVAKLVILPGRMAPVERFNAVLLDVVHVRKTEEEVKKLQYTEDDNNVTTFYSPVKGEVSDNMIATVRKQNSELTEEKDIIIASAEYALGWYGIYSGIDGVKNVFNNNSNSNNNTNSSINNDVRDDRQMHGTLQQDGRTWGQLSSTERNNSILNQKPNTRGRAKQLSQPDEWASAMCCTIYNTNKNNYDAVANKAYKHHGIDTPTLQQAIVHNWERWGPVVKIEVDKLMKTSLRPVTKDEVGDNLIVNMMVDLKAKKDPNNVWVKDKCRINIRGDEEIRRGLFPDKQANYTPTAKTSSYMLLFALAAYLKLDISG